MPESYGSDVRGIRDPISGTWRVQPVEDFNAWKAMKQDALGINPF